MPLHSFLGEQTLNPATPADGPGGSLHLIPDSDYDLFGIIQQEENGTAVNYAFFIIGVVGSLTPRYVINQDQPFYMAAYDQDAYLFYPADDAAPGFAPFTFFSESLPHTFEGDVSDYPPDYLFTGDDLLLLGQSGPVSVGDATQTPVGNGSVRAYEAPDGDGSGIFIDVRDPNGNRIGGVIRVNGDAAGNQVDPIVGAHDETFTVAWTQGRDGATGAADYRATTFDLSPNLDLAITGVTGNQTVAGDKGDYFTDIFFWDTAAGAPLGRDRIDNFGANDILVTTTRISDRDHDGIITFGSNKRLDLADASGQSVGDIAFTGVKSLEFDGTVVLDGSGKTYFIYSRVGSAADEHYLILF